MALPRPLDPRPRLRERPPARPRPTREVEAAECPFTSLDGEDPGTSSSVLKKYHDPGTSSSEEIS